ncbi:hypothetical protein J5N97_028387 [Dioscorea zingiberensis]|uniref:WD repeat-containing protein 75 second beta-propeller domain-containing protein n=1 Tax=Dioscorea zingiberensis TaxID=325984 RepID=A0A9D5BZ37_9LILI|nr:hypothetical protein J5N97_028387 [Dioscorea zingiberensis]
MGTVEVKLPEEGLGGLVNLKFWTQGTKTAYPLLFMSLTVKLEFLLLHFVLTIAPLLLVVTSRSGFIALALNIKIKCFRNQAGYADLLEKANDCGAFSSDGSVLAVAAETVGTLWDSDTNVLVAVIGNSFTPIVALSFVGESEYLVSVSQGLRPQLALWNLPKLSMH